MTYSSYKIILRYHVVFTAIRHMKQQTRAAPWQHPGLCTPTPPHGVPGALQVTFIKSIFHFHTQSPSHRCRSVHWYLSFSSNSLGARTHLLSFPWSFNRTQTLVTLHEEIIMVAVEASWFLRLPYMMLQKVIIMILTKYCYFSSFLFNHWIQCYILSFLVDWCPSSSLTKYIFRLCISLMLLSTQAYIQSINSSWQQTINLSALCLALTNSQHANINDQPGLTILMGDSLALNTLYIRNT